MQNRLNMHLNPTSGHYMNKSLVMEIHDCEATCEHMINHIKTLPDSNTRTAQGMLLRDCADICSLTAKFIARGAIFTRSAAAMCADICQACGDECNSYPDEMSVHCAGICYNCAFHCRTFAATVMDRNMNHERIYSDPGREWEMYREQIYNKDYNNMDRNTDNDMDYNMNRNMDYNMDYFNNYNNQETNLKDNNSPSDSFK